MRGIRNGKGHKRHYVPVRFTDQQLTKLQQLAAIQGVCLSEAMRNIVDGFTVDVTWPSSQAQEMKQGQR